MTNAQYHTLALLRGNHIALATHEQDNGSVYTLLGPHDGKRSIFALLIHRDGSATPCEQEKRDYRRLFRRARGRYRY